MADAPSLDTRARRFLIQTVLLRLIGGELVAAPFAGRLSRATADGRKREALPSTLKCSAQGTCFKTWVIAYDVARSEILGVTKMGVMSSRYDARATGLIVARFYAAATGTTGAAR